MFTFINQHKYNRFLLIIFLTLAFLTFYASCDWLLLTADSHLNAFYEVTEAIILPIKLKTNPLPGKKKLLPLKGINYTKPKLNCVTASNTLTTKESDFTSENTLTTDESDFTYHYTFHYPCPFLEDRIWHLQHDLKEALEERRLMYHNQKQDQLRDYAAKKQLQAMERLKPKTNQTKTKNKPNQNQNQNLLIDY